MHVWLDTDLSALHNGREADRVCCLAHPACAPALGGKARVERCIGGAHHKCGGNGGSGRGNSWCNSWCVHCRSGGGVGNGGGAKHLSCGDDGSGGQRARSDPHPKASHLLSRYSYTQGLDGTRESQLGLLVGSWRAGEHCGCIRNKAPTYVSGHRFQYWQRPPGWRAGASVAAVVQVQAQAQAQQLRLPLLTSTNLTPSADVDRTTFVWVESDPWIACTTTPARHSTCYI